ncbi:RNA polymerase II-associated factor 1 homolog [Convolutriloba macropyga]|uniref:RNA polymerase II-associated factor 1 homolog n=1 Tax=Convolutriloba macropyga TaxID=536237 RepID=UPI003F51B313
MPPTVQEQTRREHRSHGASEKRSELYSCRVKYNNTLPDIPFDPKFVAYPFDMNRYVQYKPTSLEKSFKSELLTEVDLGIPIELIDSRFYRFNPNDELDPADERLLEEETVVAQNSKRSKQHARNISWLRRTEYISSELGRYGLSSDKAEIKIGAQIKKLMKEEDLYRDRESQIKAIEKTFEDSKSPIEKHHSKQGVYKVSEYPVYPDFKLWAHPYAQVIFDADPAPKDRPAEEQISDMSQAMIRGMMDESGDQFVAYFLPTEETRRKRKLDQDQGIEFNAEQEYHYKLTREYGWTVKNKASKGYEETYFFIFRPSDNGVFYNELETRVRLNKRRKLGQNISQLTNSVLAVTHRDFNANEAAAQENRMTQLEPAIAEEDDDEEEDEEEEADVVDGEEDDKDGEDNEENMDQNENKDNNEEDEEETDDKSKIVKKETTNDDESDEERKAGTHAENNSKQDENEDEEGAGSGASEAEDASDDNNGSENENEEEDEQQHKSSATVVKTGKGGAEESENDNESEEEENPDNQEEEQIDEQEQESEQEEGDDVDEEEEEEDQVTVKAEKAEDSPGEVNNQDQGDEEEAEQSTSDEDQESSEEEEEEEVQQEGDDD